MYTAPYNFPGVSKPFAHQILTFDFVLNKERCFVFNGIGTGKTFSVAWAADYLSKVGEVKRILIVAPLSTLDVVWRRTFFYVDPSLHVEVLKGTAAKRCQLLSQQTLDGRIACIVNPDALHIIAEEKALAHFDMIVVDESAMFRKQNTRRGKALASIAKTMKRVVMLTGSPMPEAPTDIWFTAKIVCPDRVPKFFGQFRDLTMKKVSQFRWVALPNAQETISEMLAGYTIRFTRDDCLDLPETQTASLDVPATKEQTKMLAELREQAAIEIEGGMINAGNEAVVINKMLQICSGAVKYTSEEHNDSIKTVPTNKFAALADLIEASEQPVIVYSDFKAVLASIAEWLEDNQIPNRIVWGDTSGRDRLEAFDAVQNGSIKVLVAHPRAMAHGITLTTSNIIVWWSPIFSHEIYEQASGRITRPGQLNRTYIVHFNSSALERKVLKRLETKQALQGLLLEYLAQHEGSNNEEFLPQTAL